jgi:hypothetical protein
MRSIRPRRLLGCALGEAGSTSSSATRGAQIRNSAGLLGPGLDVRGEGGYVVVPPSRTQSSYQWIDSSALAEASWLIERLAERDDATLF